MGDLNMLLRYICQYVPMGAGGAMMQPPPGVGRPLTDTASTSDGVRVHRTLFDDVHVHEEHEKQRAGL